MTKAQVCMAVMTLALLAPSLRANAQIQIPDQSLTCTKLQDPTRTNSDGTPKAGAKPVEQSVFIRDQSDAPNVYTVNIWYPRMEARDPGKISLMADKKEQAKILGDFKFLIAKQSFHYSGVVQSVDENNRPDGAAPNLEIGVKVQGRIQYEGKGYITVMRNGPTSVYDCVVTAAIPQNK